MRSAIALLITLFFIMAITITIGLGLKEVNRASTSVENEQFKIETTILLDDVMKILKESKELKLITEASDRDIQREAFNIFLTQASFIPFESNGYKVIIEISSAREKFNINSLDTKTVPFLKDYLMKVGINADEYVNILLDGIGGVKEDLSYNSAVFNDNIYLFRDYITSLKHLREFNNFYNNNYRDNMLKSIKFEELFYFSMDKTSYNIDLNHATKEVWKLMLGCDDTRASQLSSEAGSYTQLKKFLDDSEIELVKKFRYSFYEPYIYVKVEIIKNRQNAKISFEYDMKNNRGYNFIYEIQ